MPVINTGLNIALYIIKAIRDKIMAISFEKALGISQYTVGVRSKRAEILASNIINADTPHYKAKDIDFAKAMESAKSHQSSGIAKTHDKHFDIDASSSLGDSQKFRVPNHPDTGDGNTVDVQVERNLYVENTLKYQTSLEFLGGKFKGLNLAIKGA